MADLTIKGLNPLSPSGVDLELDLAPIWDDSASETKKMSLSDLQGLLSGIYGESYVFVSANGTDTENAAELQAAYNLAKTKASVVNTWVPLISGGFIQIFGSSISESLSPPVSFPWVYGQTYDIRLDGVQYTAVDAGSTSSYVQLSSVTAPSNFYSDLEVLGTSITRAVVVVAPGNFNFSSNFVVDEEAVDIVSLDGNRSIVFNGAGTISVTANDVFLKGIDVGSKSFALSTNLSSIVVENCKGGNNSFGSTGIASGTFIDCEAGTFSFGGTSSGIFRNCKATSDSFGRNGTASGTFIDCVGGGTCFSYAGNASGRFINCEGGSSSFGGGGTASGTFINCRGTGSAFGNSIATASGIFTNCQANGAGFGSYGTASGTFTNCQANSAGFGERGTASGVFNSCIGGTNSFGNGSGGVLSGKLYYCRLTTGTFQTVSSGGKTRLCIDGNDSENNQG